VKRLFLVFLIAILWHLFFLFFVDIKKPQFLPQGKNPQIVFIGKLFQSPKRMRVCHPGDELLFLDKIFKVERSRIPKGVFKLKVERLKGIQHKASLREVKLEGSSFYQFPSFLPSGVPFPLAYEIKLDKFGNPERVLEDCLTGDMKTDLECWFRVKSNRFFPFSEQWVRLSWRGDGFSFKF
jgi:hypothetical protein